MAESDETTTGPVFELVCTDCTFERTVEGTFYDALDVADEHQEENGTVSTEHFVNFRRND